MDMATALADLGVTPNTLEAATSERLDRDGYAPLPGILTSGQLETMRAGLAELTAAEGEAAGIEVHQEAGTDRLADLVNKAPVFEVWLDQRKYLRPDTLARLNPAAQFILDVQVLKTIYLVGNLANCAARLAEMEVIPIAWHHDAAHRADQPSPQRVPHRAQQPAGRRPAGAGERDR